MSIAAEAVDEVFHLLVQHGVVGYVAAEFLVLLLIRELAVHQEIAAFHEVGIFGDLLNGITAIQEDAFITIDVGYFGFGGGGGDEARVVGEVAGGEDGADVDDRVADGGGVYG